MTSVTHAGALLTLATCHDPWDWPVWRAHTKLDVSSLSDSWARKWDLNKAIDDCLAQCFCDSWTILKKFNLKTVSACSLSSLLLY